MTITTRTLLTIDDNSVWATAEQANTIKALSETRKGGFARIYGYVAKTDRTIPQVYDATVTTRFSYTKLIERKKKGMASLTVADIAQAVAKQPKLAALTQAELQKAFAERLQSEIASFDKTTSGVRDDAHRQGHDRCYMTVAQGIVLHYQTAKDADGLMQPVLLDGFPIADSVMLNCLEVSRNVREQGQYKVVNSGVPVLISNAIKAALKAKQTQ